MIFCRSILAFIAGLAIAIPAHAQDAQEVQFNRDIRPILSDNCYACHGPDENQRQADLRLDNRDGALHVVEDGEDSELIRRVLSTDLDEVMPPAEHRKKLTDQQKRLLKRWVEQGAAWESHWAWIPPRATATPAINDSQWARNYIDHYVLRKLESAGLQPSPQADRVTLIRRAYFDLIGLPPTPQQVDAFLADTSDNAFEKVVDQLLASPHFGERLAIYWLDLVRYADTVGYHGDQEISVSPYRDYVIDAFNANMPFDQFTREQLAGDLLPQPTDQQLIASGYNRLGMMSAEGGVQPEEYLLKYAADRVRTTASVWLGVTLGCAECHDHKFDPFSAEDFYSFASFFADIKERGLYSGANSSGDWGPMIDVPDEALAGLLEPIDKDIKNLVASMTAPPEVMASEQDAWEAGIHQRTTNWTSQKPQQFASYHQTAHKILDDHSILMTGPRTDEDCYVMVFELPQGTHSGLRLEVLPDDSLPQKGPGRAGNGNLVVTQLLALRGEMSDRMEHLKKVYKLWDADLLKRNLELRNASATVEQASGGQSNPYGKWSAASAIDHDSHGPTFGWAILPETGKENELVVQFAEPMTLQQPEKITIVLQQYHGAGGHLLGRFRISMTSDPQPSSNPFRSVPADVQALLVTEADQRSDEQRHELSAYFHSIAPRFAQTRNQIAERRSQREQLVTAHTRTSPITVAVSPRETRVLARGNWMDKSGPIVTPRYPKLLGGQASSERLSRLDLSNWMVARQNPLTARVFVNRLWKMYFGSGLSKVLDDLGSQGQWPSHPELLDRLAIEFVDSGWDVKKMIRAIVTSQTWRQSSAARDDLNEMDPGNQRLARQSRFRHDAEILRDNALAVSGLLVDEIGGRSAKPYQPAGLYRHLNFPKREYQAAADQSQFRRGVYTHWQRQFLHPAMKAFDAPAREECTCERPRSNTPVGALVLLNDPSYVEAARKLAERVMKLDAVDQEAALQQMFRLTLSRQPNERETRVLIELYQEHKAHYATDDAAARELVNTGIAPVPVDLPIAELAAWTSVARTIMNLHEFVTRN